MTIENGSEAGGGGGPDTNTQTIAFNYGGYALNTNRLLPVNGEAPSENVSSVFSARMLHTMPADGTITKMSYSVYYGNNTTDFEIYTGADLAAVEADLAADPRTPTLAFSLDSLPPPDPPSEPDAGGDGVEEISVSVSAGDVVGLYFADPSTYPPTEGTYVLYLEVG
jgi:hypothetical protein